MNQEILIAPMWQRNDGAPPSPICIVDLPSGGVRDTVALNAVTALDPA
jgi:hypothetical protein